MAQLSVNDLTFYYEGSFEYIFEHVSFSIDTNWKIGFIGRNGKGKTTFLNLLMGKEEYYGSIKTSTAFDYFPYAILKHKKTFSAIELVETWKPGCEEWKIFCELDKHKKEIKKLKKASERTRDWADKSENRKIGFDPVKEHERNISTRAYIGSKTKKMQSRVKQMEVRIGKEIEEKEGLLKDIEDTAKLKITPLRFHKDILVTARQYGLKYADGNEWIFENLSFQITQGDRIFLHGKNGSGKTSLIKAILKNVSEKQDNMAKNDIEEKGELFVSSGLVISYLSQDTSFLNGSLRDFCRERGIEESLLCALLRQMGMERAQFEKKLQDYSEGQKKKVLISSSLLTPAHLYIWDEPFNYIDVFSRMQIEDLLSQFHPTMLLVEHDARFREQVATKVIEL